MLTFLCSLVTLVILSRQLVEMISAEKARKRKKGSIKQDIQEHIQWLEERLEQINLAQSINFLALVQFNWRCPVLF